MYQRPKCSYSYILYTLEFYLMMVFSLKPFQAQENSEKIQI